MPITIACSDCGKKYSVTDAAAGKRVKCKACGNSFIATPIGTPPAAPRPAAPAPVAPAPVAPAPARPTPPRPAPPQMPAPPPMPAAPAVHKLMQQPPPDEEPPKSNAAVRLVLILAGCLIVAGGVAVAIVKPWSSSSKPDLTNPNAGAGIAAPGPVKPAGPSAAEMDLAKQSESNLRFLANHVMPAAKGGTPMSVSELNDSTTHYARESPFDASQENAYVYLPQNADKGPDAILLYDRVQLKLRGSTQAITVGQKVLRLTKAQLQARPEVPKP